MPKPLIPYQRRQFYLSFYAISKRLFTTTRPLHHDTPPDHYKTLNLQPNATSADIKRQFYSLSKLHHPDLHPQDPTAPSRFHALSEAYTTLIHERTRRAYDSTLPSSHPNSPSHRRGGSYYSSGAGGGVAGGRAPSGLSRRRGTFRGPPPSFYAQGSYGEYAAKRAAAAAAGRSHANAKSSESSNNSKTRGKIKPEEAEDYAASFDPLSAHWDRASHFKTHESLAKRAEERARERARVVAEGLERRDERRGMFLRFLVVSGIVGGLGMGLAVQGVWMRGGGSSGNQRRGSSSGG